VSNVLKVCDVRVGVLPVIMWVHGHTSARNMLSSAIKHSVASSWFSSLRLYNDARTNIHQILKDRSYQNRETGSKTDFEPQSDCKRQTISVL